MAIALRLLRRRSYLALAEALQAMVDPQLGQLLLRAVLRQALAQGREIDAVHVLVLVEAREHDRFGAARLVVVALQALRADLLHHALHRRVDRRDRAVVRAEIALQRGAARLGDRVHHAVRADRDDTVDLLKRDVDRAERPLSISLDRRDDVADKSQIPRPARRETG